ncbi:MAG: hypothetical protein OEZ34_08475 [Spirochaetia bacterium]|nr:hypothetical protein [Spirochaetia bacterium]
MPESPSIYPFLQYSLINEKNDFVKIPELENGNIFNVLISEDRRTLKRPFQEDRSIDSKDFLTFSPFLGKGFFIYKKVGKEISFLTSDGEVLWKKPFSSYPVTDPMGRVILLLTGDNNRVDLADMNGNPAGVFSVSGNFLSDYDFSIIDSVILLSFANGDIALLSKEGNLLLRFQISSFLNVKGEETLFVKSNSVSSDGKRFAVHYVFKERDYVSVFSFDKEDPESFQKEYEISLDRIYPHILHFAVESSGILIAAPDSASFYNEDGELLWKNKLQEKEEIYRPVFSLKHIFAYMEGNTVHVFDSSGVGIDSFRTGGKEEGPFRILPFRKDDQFVIQGKHNLYYYQFLSAEESI